MAWREDGFVKWEKGLNLEQMKLKCATLPIPFIAHFRIASCGGKKDALCHPFPIERNVSLATKGQTKGFVLFHNGHWAPWKDRVMEAMRFTPWKVPAGKWSDTRALAWYAAHHGLGALEFIDEKVAILGPNKGDLEIFGTTGSTNGWSLVEEVWASNTFFQHGGRGRTSSTHGSHQGGSFYHTTPPASLAGAKERETNSLPLAQKNSSANTTGGHSESGSSDAVHVEVKQEATSQGTGGSSAASPFTRKNGKGGLKIDLRNISFAEATKLWHSGQLSRKKWKKARRRYEREQEIQNPYAKRN